MSDDRFTYGLFADVADVLERHGYARPDGDTRNAATGAALGALSTLVRAFEGAQAARHPACADID